MPDDDFGYTLWGRDWVRLAQQLRQTRPEPLLPRARKLARDGRVHITIDGAVVRGAIQHGQKTEVTLIEVQPVGRETKAWITTTFGADRTVITDELHRAITTAGHPLAPVVSTVGCTCAAKELRCLHVLAVYYDMARRVDEDPRIAVDVQGFFSVPEREAGDATSTAPERWTPIRALNPAEYFDNCATEN